MIPQQDAHDERAPEHTAARQLEQALGAPVYVATVADMVSALEHPTASTEFEDMLIQLQTAFRPGHQVETGFDKLDPSFRAALERVIERVRVEMECGVCVVETWRSQERQDLLFAIGRTQPGDVVTWTPLSKHTYGLAADLMLSCGSAETYRKLARIAAEEGLKTDPSHHPGHVEWDGIPAAMLQRSSGAK